MSALQQRAYLLSKTCLVAGKLLFVDPFYCNAQTFLFVPFHSLVATSNRNRNPTAQKLRQSQEHLSNVAKLLAKTCQYNKGKVVTIIIPLFIYAAAMRDISFQAFIDFLQSPLPTSSSRPPPTR